MNREFSHSSWVVFFNFSFISPGLMVSTFNIPEYLEVSFSLSVQIFPWFDSLIGLFLPSFVVFLFSLLAWRIFLGHISSLYLDYIFLTACIKVYTYFSFFVNSLMSSLYISMVDFFLTIYKVCWRLTSLSNRHKEFLVSDGHEWTTN